MAIQREFADMLNEHLTLDLMNNEFEKRCYAYQKLEKDNSWKGGTLPVPIKGAQASSIMYGGYTAEADLAHSKYLRGEITDYKTLTYSLPFRHRDIIEHNGRVNRDSFLKVLTSNLDDAMMFLKNAVSINLLNGGWYDRVTINGTVAGVLGVANTYRFQIGQKIKVGAAGAVTGYVRAIDKNAGTITLFDAREGGAAVDVSSATVAGDNKIYLDGQEAEAFFSIREAILPAFLDGSDILHGLAKATNPNLQARIVDGSALTATTIIDGLFDAYTDVRQAGGATGTVEAVCSWKTLGHVMKKLEAAKVGYRVVENSRKDLLYGVTEIEIASVAKGERVKLVGIAECDNDVVYFIDWKHFGFHSNGGIRKVKTPDGNEFYPVRTTEGYTYIVDIELFGDLSAQGAGKCGALHSLSL